MAEVSSHPASNPAFWYNGINSGTVPFMEMGIDCDRIDPSPKVPNNWTIPPLTVAIAEAAGNPANPGTLRSKFNDGSDALV